MLSELVQSEAPLVLVLYFERVHYTSWVEIISIALSDLHLKFIFFLGLCWFQNHIPMHTGESRMSDFVIGLWLV